LSEFAVGEVESADLPDTANAVAVPTAPVLLMGLLAVLAVHASMRGRRRPACVAEGSGPAWEAVWQDLYR
jgi:hypothetical protein